MGLAGSVGQLEVVRVVDEKPADLKEYGLNPDNPDLVKVRVQTREGQSATVLFGKSEGAAATGMRVPFFLVRASRVQLSDCPRPTR